MRSRLLRLSLAALAAPACSLALTLGMLGTLATASGSEGSEGPVQIRIAGAGRTVFDWEREACTSAEGPDLPVRAFRDYRHRVQLLLSHYVNFRLIGRSLERLRNDCRPVLRSRQNGSPSRFEDREWIASLFTTDGRRVWALLDEEYQGNRHLGRCPTGSYFQCWYNAVTLARSTDGGGSYVHAPAPRQLVATSPRPYQPGVEPIGVFTPSNIVTGPDGAYYALVRVRNPDGTRGVCLLRTTRPSVASSWRAWTGEVFTGTFSDPYAAEAGGQAPCALVGRGAIAEMTESLTYNTVLRRYLLVGLAPPGPESIGEKVTGIYFSTSTDLIHWTPRQLIVPSVSAQTYSCGGPSPIAYPSIVDPHSRSRTYATSGRRPYLYFTQFVYSSCRQSEDRNLIRVPLEISP